MAHLRTLFLLVVVALSASACTLEITRNEDASLAVEGVMTEAELESELELAISDSLVEDLIVDVRDGFIFATARRQHPDNSGVDTLSFRLDLGVNDGRLAATITEARLNGAPVAGERVARWNRRLADRLERAAGRHPNSELQAVNAGDDAVTMIWRVETWRSRRE